MRLVPVAAAAALSLAFVGQAAQAAEIVRVAPPNAMIARGVIVPAGSTMFYVSGITPPALNPGATPAVYGDTKTQTTGVLNLIKGILEGQGWSMKDVVMMRVVLVKDPAKDNKMDFAGMNEAYRTFFGTAEQPNVPARITTEIAGLANPNFLVEIEVQAAKAP